jgi:hypothetical protein
MWLESVNRTLRPEFICIADNASPCKSPLRRNENVQWLDLPRNAGHASQSVSHLSGWSESFLATLEVFLASSADMYVYFEQTLLVSADGFREELWRRSTQGPVLTSGKGSPQPVNSALFAVRREHAKVLLDRYRSLRHRDSVVSPERKLLAAASGAPLPLLNSLPGAGGGRLVSLAAFASWKRNWSGLGGGRARPIPWHKSYSLKHPSLEELRRYLLGNPAAAECVPASLQSLLLRS